MNFVHTTSSDGRTEIFDLDHPFHRCSVLHEAKINGAWIDFDLSTLEREAPASEHAQRAAAYRDLCLDMQVSIIIHAIDFERQLNLRLSYLRSSEYQGELTRGSSS